MKKYGSRLLCILLLAPVPVGYSTSDTTGTEVTVTGGFGQFADVSRDCSGGVIHADKIPFNELNVSIRHRPNRNIELGLKTSSIFTDKYGSHFFSDHYFEDGRTFIANPTINFGGRYANFGIGFGMTSGKIPYFTSQYFPSFYLGFGNMRKFYFDMSFLHTDPLISSGYFKLGFGGTMGPRFRMWVGTGVGPHDRLGLILNTETRVSDRFYINAMGRIGSSAGISENGLNVGLTYRLR